MKSGLPLYSQHLDVKDKSWRDRACGVIALKTLLDYLKVDKSTEVNELISRGIALDGYIKNIGWKHKELGLIANQYGLFANNFDWSTDNNDVAFEKLKNHIDKYPVLCSIYKNLNPNNSGHLVVVYKYDKSYIYYLDPDSKNRNEIERSAPINTFLNGWKKRVVVIYK